MVRRVLKERKLQRLKGYDYSRNNHYFVTICTHKMTHFFGEIRNGEMVLNEFGEIVKNQWISLGEKYNYLLLDEYVVMPNHFHAILVIDDSYNKNGQARSVRLREENFSEVKYPFVSINNNSDLSGNREIEKSKILSLSQLIGAFKTLSSRDIYKLEEAKYNNRIFKWHKSFHDRIIRDDKELYNVRNYIKNNPKKWQIDTKNKNS